jgi:hypothetical protein
MLYASCALGANESIVSFDVASGQVVKVAVLPPRIYCEYAMAEDVVRGTLFCLSGVGDLLEVNLRNGTVTNGSSLGIARVAPWSPLWCDSHTSLLYLADSRRDAIEVIDPHSGVVSERLGFPSFPRAITGDPAANRLYVSYGNGTGNSSVLNLTTFATITTLPVFAEESIELDPTHGDVYFDDFGEVYVASLQTLTLTQGSPIREPGYSVDAYDPTDDLFIELGSGLSPALGESPISHTMTSPAPYSSIPTFGVATPFVVAIGLGVLGGASLIVWGIRVHRRRVAEGEEWFAQLTKD